MLPRVKALLHGAVLALALVLGIGAAPAHGQEPTTEPAFGVEVHAFLSQGFVLSTDNNYLTRSKDGSVEFTEAAVNFTKWISDDFRIGIQLFARKLTPSDDYVPIFDWYYADYRIADWLGVRAGRTKIPFGLYNEINDVDAARVPILLPQSIYPDHHRELLLAQNGGEIYGTIPIGVLGGLEYRLYGGTFSLDGCDEEPNPNLASAEAEVSYIAGGRVLWMTPLEGLIAGLSLQSMRYEIDSRFKPEVTAALIAGGVAPADYDGSLVLGFPITLWVASLEHTFEDVSIAIEYGRWWADLHSSVPALVPSTGPTNERFYAMASYRVNEYFVPGMYFASYYEDVDAKGEPGKFQHDLALTLRFDLTPFWLVKAEGHLIRGTALLSTGLNDNKELKDLESRWGLFLLKTTAYF
jgi:hypothetical protein